MTDYIIDASIVVQELIRDIYSQQVRQLFEGLTAADRLHIPEFCLLECTNVLWKQVRFHGMPQTEAEQLINDLVALPLTIVPVTGLLSRGLQIGVPHQLAIYDSIYIALAEKLNLPLITADTRQETVAKEFNIIIKPITDF